MFSSIFLPQDLHIEYINPKSVFPPVTSSFCICAFTFCPVLLHLPFFLLIPSVALVLYLFFSNAIMIYPPSSRNSPSLSACLLATPYTIASPRHTSASYLSSFPLYWVSYCWYIYIFLWFMLLAVNNLTAELNPYNFYCVLHWKP